MNPSFQVTVASTGVAVVGAAAAGGAAIGTLSTGTNENLTIDAKGSGTISLGLTSTGNLTLGRATGVTGAVTVTSTSASALTVGRQGATNPQLQVDASVASVVTGLGITGAASGGGVTLAPISSGSNEDLILNAKGTGHAKIPTFYSPMSAEADASTITFDMSVDNVHTPAALAGNRTLAVSNVAVGQRFMIKILQDGTGSRTVTWFATIKWAGGSAPTLTTTANKADWFGFVCTGSGTFDGVVVMSNV